MRIEEVTPLNVDELSTRELQDLVGRSNQIYQAQRANLTQINKRVVGVKEAIPREDLFATYSLITGELTKRGITWTGQELDEKIRRKNLQGVDVGELSPVVVKRNVVALSGEFVHNPKIANAATVRIDADQFEDELFNQELQKRVYKEIQKQTGLGSVIRTDAEGLTGQIVPVYDLVLMPRERTCYEDSEELIKRLNLRSKRTSDVDSVNTLKSEESAAEDNTDSSTSTLTLNYTEVCKELVSVQKPVDEFSDFHRKALEKGVFAIYGIKGGKSKVQSVRFDGGVFDVDTAKAWLIEHKMNDCIEDSSVEKSEASFVKGDVEERVCGGIVYAPNSVDSQGDFVSDPNELWKAMKGWMVKTGGFMKFMHDGEQVLTPVVENFQPDEDTVKCGQVIPAGAWYISCYIPEQFEKLWQGILSGAVTGFSMAGTSAAEIVELEEEE